MKTDQLKSKKITMATLKAFIKNANELFVEAKSDFCGMTDCVQTIRDSKMVKVSKENAIGHNGVWCVGGSRDYFTYMENDNYFGIEVSNCCGHAVLWTKK